MTAATRKRVHRPSRGVLAIGLLGLASAARAEPPPLELEWWAPPRCPSRMQILAGVSAVLGRSAGERRQVAARVRVQDVKDELFLVEITSVVNGVAGDRVFEAESCAAASDAAILILALLVNPTAPREPEGIAPAAAPPPVSATLTHPRARTRARKRDARVSTSKPQLAVGLWPAFDRGSMPGWSEGLLGSLAHTRGPLRFEAFGGTWLRQTSYARDSASAGADFRRFTLGFSSAFLWRGEALAAGPFVGVALDHLSAKGFGGAEAFERSVNVISPLGGGRFEWSLTRFLSCAVAVLGKVSTAQPRFVVERNPSGQSSSIFEVAPLSLETRAGLELRFP